MIRWAKEARDMAPDPESGAKIVRLSGSSIRTENIYCDAPRATPDGTRFASYRYVDWLTTPSRALMCHDLTTKFTALLDPAVLGEVVAPAWGGAAYYLRGTDVIRADLATFEVKAVASVAGLPSCWQMMSISPDEQYLLYTGIATTEPETYNLVRLDLRTGQWQWLLPEPVPHRLGGHYHPVTGQSILVSTAVWEGKNRYGVGVLTDALGRHGREVFRRVHHACWLGDTGCFAGALEFDYERIWHLPQNPDGELMIYAADGSPARLIPIPERLLYHLSASRCGRYIVSESLCGGLSGPVPIVVINAFTGKYRTLVGDCRCSGGGDSGRQAKPYFTADNKYVIYTADPDGIVNVFSAELPAGFLSSLD